MCFPVSSVVASSVMENVKTRTLGTFADSPRLQKRYVDDTFVIIKKSKLSEFFTHLSTIELHPIHYIEQDNKKCFPFLDLLITCSSNGHLLSALYHKLTQLDSKTII